MRRGRLIEPRFERSRKGFDGGEIRPRHAGRRHHPGADHPNYFLRQFRILLGMRQIQLGQYYAAGFQLIVVATRAVLTDECPLW